MDHLHLEINPLARGIPEICAPGTLKMGLLPTALLLLAAFCSAAANAQAAGYWRRAAGSGSSNPGRQRRRLGAAGAEGWGSPLPDDWRSVVTNDTQARLLKQTASPDGVVIFTTFVLLKPEGAAQHPTG